MFHEQDFETTHLAAILKKKKSLDFSTHWTQFSYSGAEPVMTKDSEVTVEGFCAQRPANPTPPHQKSQVDYNVVRINMFSSDVSSSVNSNLKSAP